MKKLVRMALGLVVLSALSACTTVQRQGYALPVAMSEVFRGGQLKGLEDHTDPNRDLGMPQPYDLVQHTCVSQPIFNLDGSYARTAVRCY